MEVQLSPEDHARLADIAIKTGRSEIDIVLEVMGAYLNDLDEVKKMLSDRLSDIESGRVAPLSSSQFWQNIERRKDAFLTQRS